MAAHTIAAGAIAKHEVALTANTADSFTFTDDLDVVEIISSGLGETYVRVDGPAATDQGANTYRLPSGTASTREIPVLGSNKVISVISDAATIVSVTKVS